MRISLLKRAAVAGIVLAGGMEAQRLVTSVAGSELNFRGEGRPAREAPLGRINAVTVDSAGRAVFADPYYHMVLRIENDGTMTVLAGNGVRGHSGDGGPAKLAALNSPTGVAFDSAGNLYIADQRNHRIRRVSPDGIIITFAGNGAAGFRGDGDRAFRASLSSPVTVATDSRGNLFINDLGNRRIRRVDTNGNIATVAGDGTNGAGPDGPALQTSFASPETIATDAGGNLYIAEFLGDRIRRLSPQGLVTTVAGTGRRGFAGDGGQASVALLTQPGGIAVEPDGSLLILDTGNYRIRRVNRQGIIQTIAGNGQSGFVDGPAAAARFRNSTGIAVNSAGDILIADRDNFRIRRLAGSTVTTIAGNGALLTSQDGATALNTPLNSPFSVSFDQAGNMLIADTENSVVRLLTASGAMRTIAGNGAREFSGDGGPALQAGLAGPRSATFDCQGGIIIADTDNNAIRRVQTNGTIETIAGNGNASGGFAGDGGPATQARLWLPVFAISDRNCNIYIAESFNQETGNNRIRRIDAVTKQISTVAGGGSQTADGPATSTRLGSPTGLAFDRAENLYIAEPGLGRIRRLSNGSLVTVAGGGSVAPSGNFVSATSARLNLPISVTVDQCDRIYATDYDGHQVYEIESGRLRVLAGDGRRTYAGDGASGSVASFNNPIGVAVTGGSCAAPGDVYVADSGNNRIRAIRSVQPTFTPSTETLSADVTSDGAEETATLTLNSEFSGLACELQPVEPWLQVNSRTLTLPASITVRINPTGLREGTVRGSIKVNCGAARTPERTVAVVLNVKPAQMPRMVLEAEAVNLSIVAGTETVERQLTVRNTGSGTLGVTVTASTASGDPWLSATSPERITAAQSGTVGVLCVTAQLAPGIYRGAVRVQGSGNEPPVTVPVRLTVSAAPGKIVLSQAGLTFTAVSGGGAPLARDVVVRNAGQGLMFWKADSATTRGGTWLRVAQAEGSSSAAAETGTATGIAVDATGLAPGTYYGRVQVSAEGAANSPQTVSVVLNVLEANANPGPDVQPAALTFTAADTGNPSAQVVRIANLTNRPLSYTSSRTSTGGSWINVVPANATLSPGEQLRLVVQPDLTSVTAGVQTGSLDLRFDDGSSRRIDLVAIVPEGASTSGDKGVRFQSGCTPTRLVFQLTSGQSPIRTRTGQPLNLEVQILDNCGRAVEPRSGTAVALDVAGETGGPFQPSATSRWARTFQVRSSPAGSRLKGAITAFAALPNNRFLWGQQPIEFEVQGGGAVPLIEPGALRNAASLQAFAPVAPGMLITLKGQELGENPGTIADSTPLPVELGVTEVRLGNRPLRLLYVSADQVNAQVPFDITSNTEHQIQIRRGEALSVPEQFVVASVQPAIFTENQAGTGQAVAFNATTNQSGANAANPAKAGDILTVFATGLGKVTPEVEEGTAAPLDQLVYTVTPVQVSVGGVPAQVQFAGLQPGVVGRYQINFVVPEGVAPGDEVPIVVTAARQASVPVMIAVR